MRRSQLPRVQAGWAGWYDGAERLDTPGEFHSGWLQIEPGVQSLWANRARHPPHNLPVGKLVTLTASIGIP